MNLQFIFDITSGLALCGWALLVVSPLLPRWILHITMYAVPGALSLVYVALATVFFEGIDGNFDSLSRVMQLFDNEQAAMAGWIHYLAFDLFIGSWQVQQARQRRIPFWLVLLCLPVTLYLGPIGLIVFFVVSGSHWLVGRKVEDAEGLQ